MKYTSAISTLLGLLFIVVSICTATSVTASPSPFNRDNEGTHSLDFTSSLSISSSLFTSSSPVIYTASLCEDGLLSLPADPFPGGPGGIKVSIEKNIMDPGGDCPHLPTDSTEGFGLIITNGASSSVVIYEITISYDDLILKLDDFDWTTEAESRESTTTLTITPPEGSYTIAAEDTVEVDFYITRIAAGETTIDIVDADLSGEVSFTGEDQCIADPVDGRSAGLQPESFTFEEGILPDKATLEQNYPNPFNPSTVIRFTLPAQERIQIKVYDITGRLVRVLADQILASGSHEVKFDATGLPSGPYYYQLTASSYTKTRLMIFQK
jgi:hypothetical protein